MIAEFHMLVAAAVVAIAVGGLAVVRKAEGVTRWCFAAGMAVLAADAFLGAMGMRVTAPDERDAWLTAQLVAKALLPGVWLCFSLTYCRGNAREFLSRWKWLLWGALLAPPTVAVLFRADLVVVDVESGQVIAGGLAVRILEVLLLLFCVLILVNLEKTFRTAVGTVRWRIKYLFIGAGLIFGVRIYTLSQAVLFSGFQPAMTTVDAVALLIGGGLIALAHLRRGFGALDLYPSQTVLRGSITVILVGVYLLAVGVLAEVVNALGVPEGFPAQAFIVLIGMVGLAVLLLSERVRTNMHRLVTRHFRRPHHDSRAIWTRLTRSTFGVMDRDRLCRAASEVISSSFHVLTIRILIFAPDGRTLSLLTSTFDGEAGDSPEESAISATDGMREAIAVHERTFDLEAGDEEWKEVLRDACPKQFPHGGRRLGVPLCAADQVLGVMVLADRVKGVGYTQEERDLLICLADQLAAGLLNLVLSEKQMQSKELEAFQTMSTFFVHDLKNAANSLGLMLQNLPNHFDDPDFRADTLRGLQAAADRINNMIARLGTLRSRLQPELEDCDINALVEDVLGELGEVRPVVRDLQAVPKIRVDREQMASVLTNLVTNAAEASGEDGEIRVETARYNGSLVLEVADQGCGMSPEFVRDSLFRPFISTKSKGLGIGMFQSRMIVEAHRGRIDVTSAAGKGTRIRVSLPIN